MHTKEGGGRDDDANPKVPALTTETVIDASFAAQLRYYRTRAGLVQGAFQGGKYDTIHRNRIGEYERGSDEPHEHDLELIIAKLEPHGLLVGERIDCFRRAWQTSVDARKERKALEAASTSEAAARRQHGPTSSAADDPALQETEDDSEENASHDHGAGGVPESAANGQGRGNNTRPVTPPSRPQWLLISLILTAVVVVAAGVLAAALYFRNSSAPPPLSTPDELYHMVTGSKPALTDALTGHDANSWQEDTIPEGGCKYQGGAYHSYVLITAVHACLADAAPSFRCSTTFAVQVDLTLVSGDGGGGLVFCFTGPHVPYYRFVVRPEGYFDLFDPATGRGTSGFASPSTRYRLTVIVRATTIYLYINGIFMAQGSLEPGVSLSGGKVGVFAVDGPHNPTDVAFHNFSVWSAT